MKKDFSPSWIKSKQTRKQRKYRYNAPLHLRQKMLSAHLDKALRKEYKRRSMPIRTGDEVAVITGENKKKRGKISNVDLKKLKIFVDGVTTKKVTGQEMQVALDPSNVVITKLNLSDKKRLKIIRRKGIKDVKVEQESKKEEKKK